MATVSSLLRDRQSLRVCSVDRLFLHGYLPSLQTPGQLVRFLLDRGFPIPSPALLGHEVRRYGAAVDRFAARHGVPVVRFTRDQVKEEVARPHFARAEAAGRFGVVMVGIAQEKASVWRGWRHGGSDAHPHFEYGRQSAHVNYFYFYIRDPEWGPTFVKTVAYAPYGVWLYLNGHEWAKRQAEQAGLAFRALDNGFRETADEQALAAICDRLSVADIDAFMARWEPVLPSPLTAADRARGHRYALAFRQLEISDTRVLDRPATARAWFEQMIRDQLALGHPDEIGLVFGGKVTRQTPGRFRTRVISHGVDPVLYAHYKHSKIKQYLKEGVALRTETTVNDTRDFGIGRLVTQANWDALIELGHAANDRLLSQQLAAQPCAPDSTALQRIVLPSIENGLPAPGLRFGDPRVMALLVCLCHFDHLFAGITNRGLTSLVAALIPGYNSRQATYDLRRLRRKGLIRRVPRRHRYELTSEGRQTAIFFTKTYSRIVNPALAELDPRLPTQISRRSPLATSWKAFEHALADHITAAAIHA
jgi:hypothetical protein